MQQILNSIERLMGQRLSQRRSEMNLSIEELANRLQVSTDEIEVYEQGKKRLGASMLLQASKILDVEMIYFFEDDQSTPTPQSIGQKLKVTLTPEEEAQLLSKLADIEDPEMREKAVHLFKRAKEHLS